MRSFLDPIDPHTAAMSISAQGTKTPPGVLTMPLEDLTAIGAI